MNLFIITLSLFFSFSVMAQDMRPSLTRTESEVVVLMEQEDTPGQVNPVARFFHDLKTKTIELDQGNLVISCEQTTTYSCLIKTKFKSNAYRNVLHFPFGDLVITLKTKLAWAFMDLTTGEKPDCYQNYYADSFNITICPNTVDIVIHAEPQKTL